MRNFMLSVVAAAMMLAPGLAQAEAVIWAGLMKAAPYCPPGYTRACGPYRCWCRPCY